MKIKKHQKRIVGSQQSTLAVLGALLLLPVALPGADQKPATPVDHETRGCIEFKPSIESLKQYAVPEWFEDAKLGIWAHWGPQGSTDIPYPIASGWYARKMYETGGPVYRWHLKNFGHPSVFG